MLGENINIAVIGAQGVGKTTLALYLSKKLGLQYTPLEAISTASNLPVQHRQLLFLASFTKSILETYWRGDNVYDNHPVMVLAYTKYFLGTIPYYMEPLVLSLPRLSLLVYLYVDDVEVIVERIKQRARAEPFRDPEEEARREYIEAVDEITRKILENYTRYSEDLLVLPASLEVHEKAEAIIEHLAGKQLVKLIY